MVLTYTVTILIVLTNRSAYMSIQDVVKSWDEEERNMDNEIKAIRLFTDGFSCLFCKHLNEDNISCTAYPDVIPDPIIGGQYDHRRHYSGDHGILFEPKETKEKNLPV